MLASRRLHSKKSAAEYLSLSEDTIATLDRRGELTRVPVPSLAKPGKPMKRVLFDVHDLDRLADKWIRGDQ